MAGWNDSQKPGGNSPFEELGGYPYPQGGGWDEPTQNQPDGPPGPPPGPQVPLEKLGPWFERAIALLQKDPQGMLRDQALVLGLSLVSLGTLTGPLLAGYYRVCLKRLRNQPSDFNDLFSGLTANFVPNLLVGLVMVMVLGALGSITAVVCLILSQIPLLGFLLQAVFVLAAALVVGGGLGLFSLMFPLIHQANRDHGSALDELLALWQRDWQKAAVLGVCIGGPAVLGGMFALIGVILTGPISLLVAAQAYVELFESEQMATLSPGARR